MPSLERPPRGFSFGEDPGTDEKLLRSALRLARRGRGKTEPNPMVGAILVKEGRIVGRGYHHRAGEPHAEVLALREAGGEARGATLYVTLEPCSHHGRTPPCTEAIIAAGVTRVVVPGPDPNPLVSGRGLSRLAEAGIRVETGLLQEEADRLNEVFRHYIVHRRPFVLAKWAMTLDGRIATRTGASRWVSGEAARRLVHRWRSEVGAIMVGIETALRDDPELTARRPGARQPLRVVVDSRLRLPPTARLLRAPGQVLVAAAEPPPERIPPLREAGAEVLTLPGPDGRVDLARLLDVLGSREVASLLVEGGGRLLGSLLERDLVQKIHAFVAPKLFLDGPAPLLGEGVAEPDGAWHLRRMSFRRVGEDLLVTGYPERGEGDVHRSQ